MNRTIRLAQHTPLFPRQSSIPIAVATVLALFLAACGGSEKGTSAKASEKQATAEAKSESTEAGVIKLTEEETTRAGIKLETLGEKAIADSITVTATIRPNQERIARIAPRVEGRVVQVSARLGDSVRAGQALAVMDGVALGEAQSTLQQAQSARRVAQADFQRAESLITDEIIPKRDYLRAKAELEKSSAEQRAAEDKLRLLGGAQSGRRATSTFQLTAPLAGTVVERKATVGELHTPSDPLFTIADLSTVWIEANLTEDALAKVKTGAAASVTVKAYPDERFAGRVTYVASLLDKDSRTVPARIEVDNRDGRLKPEMFATATITTTAPQRSLLSVPDTAVVLMQGQPTVFVVEHGGFEPRTIDPGDKLSGRTVVKSGIKVGEQVVVAGTYALKARILKSQIGDAH